MSGGWKRRELAADGENRIGRRNRDTTALSCPLFFCWLWRVAFLFLGEALRCFIFAFLLVMFTVYEATAVIFWSRVIVVQVYSRKGGSLGGVG